CEKRGDERLKRARRRPQSKPYCLELPALAEPVSDRFRIAAVGVGVEESSVLMGENFRGRRKALLREEGGKESRQRAARLVELDGRRAPLREGPRGLAAGEAEGVALALGIEAEKLAGAAAPPKGPITPGECQPFARNAGYLVPSPTRTMLSRPAATAAISARPLAPSRSASASAGGTTSGVVWQSVGRCTSHTVTAV